MTGLLLSNNIILCEEWLASETDIEQGDPIGLALFALSVDEAARGDQSDFNVRYLADRRYPHRLPGEGSLRFSGITGEARSNWLGGQREQM